jgi:hypothetical protein
MVLYEIYREGWQKRNHFCPHADIHRTDKADAFKTPDFTFGSLWEGSDASCFVFYFFLISCFTSVIFVYPNRGFVLFVVIGRLPFILL